MVNCIAILCKLSPPHILVSLKEGVSWMLMGSHRGSPQHFGFEESINVFICAVCPMSILLNIKRSCCLEAFQLLLP